MKGWMIGILMAGTVTLGPCAWGADESVLPHMGGKLARGVANVATGWMEVPKQVYLVGRDEGWGTGAIRGPIDGLGMSIARTLAGIYDIFTFPLPVPPHYQPLLQPEYVWQAEPAETDAEKLTPDCVGVSTDASQPGCPSISDQSSVR